MAKEQLPVRGYPVADLQSLGLNPSSFRCGFLTLQSEKYICICDEDQDGSSEIVVVELQSNSIVRYPINAEAAIMNPLHNIIAFKAKNESSDGHFVQVYNFDVKQNIKVHGFPEQIVYWSWLTASKLAIVTTRTVYHWSIEDAETPASIFDRNGPLEGNVQILNYITDQSESWCLLTAISSPDEGKTINGHMQLCFTSSQQQQILEGFAGCFGEIPLKDGPAVTCFSFVEKKAAEDISRVHVMEINRPASGRRFRVTMEFSYPTEAPRSDFPLSMHLLSKYGVVAMITKFGYLYLFETVSANLIYRARLCEDIIFVSCKSSKQDAVLWVNRMGQVLGVAIEEDNLLPFIINTCRHIADAASISFTLAQRFKFADCEDLFVQQFGRLMVQGDAKGAAKVAVSAPEYLLRNHETFARLRTLLQATLLEAGKLNKYETLEIARSLLWQGRKQILPTLVQQDKIECSEELCDLIEEFEQCIALKVDNPEEFTQKVLAALANATWEQYDKIKASIRGNYIAPNYMSIIRSLMIKNPEAALYVAKRARKNVDANVVSDLFLAQPNLYVTNSYLLEVLIGDLPEQGHLQTKLLEMNIIQAPQVAEAIFEAELFSNYDKVRIAQLCEQAGLIQRALENYCDINDIRRVLVNSAGINRDFLLAFFGHMTSNNALQCLYDMMKSDRDANLQIVVEIAINYHAEITIPSFIQMFESVDSYDGLFFFLGSVLNFTEDPDVYFKYIEAAALLNQSKEVERVIRETRFYNPVEVKDFLKHIKLPDSRPFIYLCDIHGFSEELAIYLYKNSLTKYLDVYLIRLNPKAAPVVLGTLADLGADESYMHQVLDALAASCPSQPLIEEMEKRNRLRILQSWLEDRDREGNQEPAIHTALAKIYIDINKDPEDFLIRNSYYDSKIIGKHCEERNPDLAVKAYSRACGECDDELIELTNRNSMYGPQARYLVERKSSDLWAKVLSNENQHRKSVIDQVIAALPDSKDAEEVSTTVISFFKAGLQKELIELIEKIVLYKSIFSENNNLQNMLLVTAIKTEPTHVVNYINWLDNYDGPQIAQYALETTWTNWRSLLIYRKAGMNAEAIEVLLKHIGHLERASEFAERVASPEVWSRLGRAQLDADLVDNAIESFIKARDASSYQLVITAAERKQSFTKLIEFLMLARSQQLNQKDPKIDTELLFALAKCGMLNGLEEAASNTNQTDIEKAGDRCFDEELYEAAWILFAGIDNYARLASCLVKLKRFMEAIEAAKNANNPKVWEEVNFACAANKDFELAIMAGQNIVTHPDHSEDVIRHYEHDGNPDELIDILESGEWMSSSRHL